MSKANQLVLTHSLPEAATRPLGARVKHWLLAPVRAGLHRMVRMMERKLGISNEAMHFIADTSVGGFLDLLLVARMAHRRVSLPKAEYHLACIVATRRADCGSCVQAQVNMALAAGVNAKSIQAAIDGTYDALTPELRDVCEFVGHVVGGTYEEDELREKLRARHGDLAMIDLAYAVAGSQIFPFTKRTLGFAASCSQVRVKIE